MPTKIMSLFGSMTSFPYAQDEGVQDTIIAPFLGTVKRETGVQKIEHVDSTDHGDDIYEMDGVQYLMNISYYRDDVETHLHDANEVRVSLQPWPWY